MKLCLALLCDVLISSCLPSISPKPAPLPVVLDAGSPNSKVDGKTLCAHLEAIGCAQPPHCVDVYDSAQGVVTDFRPGCVMNASSVVEVEACGSVLCAIPKRDLRDAR